jgi:hypothetical protein
VHEKLCVRLGIYEDSYGRYKENNNDNDWYQFTSCSKHYNTVISFISVINQLDAQNFCFTISLFHHHTYRCDDTRGCVMRLWPPDDEHMCSKHVEAWNKLIVKQKICASNWLITEINILRRTVSKTSKFANFVLYICRVTI